MGALPHHPSHNWEQNAKKIIKFALRARREKYICYYIGAGWSSPVAREAHNLEVVGSNPAPATSI